MAVQCLESAKPIVLPIVMHDYLNSTSDPIMIQNKENRVMITLNILDESISMKVSVIE